MLISRSIGRKIIATSAAAVAFVMMYEVTAHDARFVPRAEGQEAAAPAPGVKLRVLATAYCKGTTTASGVNVRTGIAAADPDLLPVGSVLRVENAGDRYNGIYTVMDTGPKVQGRHIDIYMWSCHEALAFGAPRISVTVLRLGWNPRTSTPRRIFDRLFHRAAADPAGALPPASSPPRQPD